MTAALLTHVAVQDEMSELAEGMRHCRAAYLRTFTSLPNRQRIAAYYARLNRAASALSAKYAR